MGAISRKCHYFQATRVLPSVLGLTLIAASFLKAFALPGSQTGPRSLSVVQVGCEWLLGVWLLSGLYRRAACGLAAVAFAAFACYAFYQGVENRASCGCFGTLPVSPWVTFAFDLLAVAGAAAVWRYVPRDLAMKWGARRVAGASVGAAAGVAMALGLAFAPSQGLSEEGKRALKATPTPASGALDGGAKLVCDLGYVPPGSTHSLEFRLANPTGHPVPIRRVEAECQCTTLRDPPTVLPAGAVTPLRATFVAPDHAQEYEKSVVVLPADPQAPPTVLKIRARVGLPLSARPAAIDLGEVRVGKEANARLTVLNGGADAARVLYCTSDDASCVVRVPRDNEVRGALALEVTLTPRGPGARQAAVQVHTSVDAQSVLTVPVRWVAVGGP